MKTVFTKGSTFCIIFLIMIFLFPFIINKTIADQSASWWNSDWRSYIPVNLTETVGIDRIEEPVDVNIDFDEGTCRDPEIEVRVLYFDGNDWFDVPCQVYNVSYKGTYATSCNVVFMANCTANDTITYYIYYNNRFATRPVYDGLRLYEELEGDTYTINVTAGNEEKKYFRIFWKKNVDLYCDGVELARPGGKAGWEFSQMIFSSLWEDDEGNYWFSSNINAVLEVLNKGPLFVDFHIKQPVATDLWGGVFNSNVSTSYTIRLYYRRNLNPLLKFQTRFDYTEDAATKSPWFFTLKLANGTSTQVDSTYIEGSYEVYEHTTFKNTEETLLKVPAENSIGSAIWSEFNPVGWWSFNGSRQESEGKPSGNIGIIPVEAVATNATYDCKVHFNSQLEENDNEAWFFLGNITNGFKGESIKTLSFINTYSLVENAVPSMTKTAETLRNPLESKIGLTVTKPITKRDDFVVRPYQDISEMSVFSDGEAITMNLTFCSAIPEVGWQYLNIYITFDTLDGGNYWFPDGIDVKYPEEYPYAWDYCLKISNIEDILLTNNNFEDLGSSNISVTATHQSSINIEVPLQSIGDPSEVSIGVVTVEDGGSVKDTLGPGAIEIINRIQATTVTAELIEFSTVMNSSISTVDVKPNGMGIGKAYWDLIDVWHGMNSTHFIVYTTFSNLTSVDWEDWRLSIAIDIDHMAESGEYWIPGFRDSRIDPAVNMTYWEYCFIIESLSDVYFLDITSSESKIEEIKPSSFGNLIITSIPRSYLQGLVMPTLIVVSGSDHNDTACNFAGTYIYNFEETPPGAYMITSHQMLIAEDRISPTIIEVIPAMREQEIIEDLTVNVNATVVDNPGGLGVRNVALEYSTDGGVAWDTINMTQIDNDVFAASMPKFRVGTRAIYVVNATDEAGNHAITPRYWYKVVSAPVSMVWFGLGLVVGSIVTVFLALTISYARRKA